MKEGLKWIITRWHFWLLVFVSFLWNVRGQSNEFGKLFISEYLGILFASFVIIFIIYGIIRFLSYLIEKYGK